MTSNEKEFYLKWEEHIRKVYDSFKNHSEIFNHDKDIEVGQQHAKEYAQMAIKHLFLINGGALIALPAIIAAFDLPPRIDVWIAGISYAMGLVLIILTSLFAYWSVVSMIHALAAEKFGNYTIFFLQNMKPVLVQQTIDEQEKARNDYQRQQKIKNRWANIWEALAVVSGILSLLAFICGTMNLTYVVWDLQRTSVFGPFKPN